MFHPGCTSVWIGLAALFVACGAPPASVGNDAGPHDAGPTGNNNDNDGGPCDLTAWTGTFSGPTSSTTTFSGGDSDTVNYTLTATVTALTNCQIQIDSGANVTTDHGSITWTTHTLIFDVSGNTATLADAQPFAGTEVYDDLSVTFSGQATTGTVTLNGTTASVDWSGTISGTTDDVPWSGTYSATGTVSKQ